MQQQNNLRWVQSLKSRINGSCKKQPHACNDDWLVASCFVFAVWVIDWLFKESGLLSQSAFIHQTNRGHPEHIYTQRPGKTQSKQKEVSIFI